MGDAPDLDLLPVVSEAIGNYGGVEVRSISGRVIATLAIDSPKETVAALRHRLLTVATDEELSGRFAQAWLVYSCTVLPDHRRLCECFSASRSSDDCDSSSPELLGLTLVSARPSSLAEHLGQAGLETSGLVDVADSVFQAEHAVSVRHMPKPEDVASGISPDLRAQVVDWLAIACRAVGLDTQILHGAVLTLDRYCALRKGLIDESQLLRLSLAVLCTEMKLQPVDD